jgi:hypothetical protein
MPQAVAGVSESEFSRLACTFVRGRRGQYYQYDALFTTTTWIATYALESSPLRMICCNAFSYTRYGVNPRQVVHC